MANIYDIARLAKVSPATVSRALNGYADVSVYTRRRVKEIADELGYRPSATARGLVTKQSKLIGVFLNDHIHHPFFHDILSSFKEAVGTEGFDLVLFSDRSQSTGMTFEARSRHRNADGLLIAAVDKSHPDLKPLIQSGIPCVGIDIAIHGERAGYVASTNEEGAFQAVEHLVSRGHRSIAFIGDFNHSLAGVEREQGFLKAIARHQLPLVQDFITYGDFTEQSGYEAAIRLLSQTIRPTAVFAAGDLMAVGAMGAFRAAGIETGRDISIIGFDDIEAARYVSPSLTTIAQNRSLMGAAAGRALISLIQKPDESPTIIRVDTSLVVRESVRMIIRSP